MVIRAIFRADAGIPLWEPEPPLSSFEAASDGLTIRITPQTREETEVFDEVEGQPITQSYHLLEALEAAVEAEADTAVIAAGTIPNELFERVRDAASSVLRRTLAWLRDSADDMDLDLRLQSLRLTGFVDASGKPLDLRVTGQRNLLLKDIGGVFKPQEWTTVAERVRRLDDVPVDRTLLLDARAHLKTANYDQALVLAAVIIESALRGLVAAVIEAVGGRSACPEGEALRTKSGKVASWLSRQECISLLCAAGVLTDDEGKLAELIAGIRNKLVHPEPARPTVMEKDARDAVHLAATLRKRLAERVRRHESSAP